jgi:hypothetical protein
MLTRLEGNLISAFFSEIYNVNFQRSNAQISRSEYSERIPPIQEHDFASSCVRSNLKDLQKMVIDTEPTGGNRGEEVARQNARTHIRINTTQTFVGSYRDSVRPSPAASSSSAIDSVVGRPSSRAPTPTTYTQHRSLSSKKPGQRARGP